MSRVNGNGRPRGPHIENEKTDRKKQETNKPKETRFSEESQSTESLEESGKPKPTMKSKKATSKKERMCVVPQSTTHGKEEKREPNIGLAGKREAYCDKARAAHTKREKDPKGKLISTHEARPKKTRNGSPASPDNVKLVEHAKAACGPLEVPVKDKTDQKVLDDFLAGDTSIESLKRLIQAFKKARDTEVQAKGEIPLEMFVDLFSWHPQMHWLERVINLTEQAKAAGGHLKVLVANKIDVKLLVDTLRVDPSIRSLKLIVNLAWFNRYPAWQWVKMCDRGGLSAVDGYDFDDSADESSFVTILDACKNIEVLDLKEARLSQGCWHVLAKHLGSQFSLRRLEISRGDDIGIHFMETFATEIESERSSLRELVIDDMSLWPSDFDRLLKALEKHGQFTLLKFQNISHIKKLIIFPKSNPS